MYNLPRKCSKDIDKVKIKWPRTWNWKVWMGKSKTAIFFSEKLDLKIRTSLTTKTGRRDHVIILLLCCCCCYCCADDDTHKTFNEIFCFSFFWENVDDDEYCFLSLSIYWIFLLEQKSEKEKRERVKSKKDKPKRQVIHCITERGRKKRYALKITLKV